VFLETAQAFFTSAKVHGAFQPLPSPPLQLTQLDQCRIRDRSTIMARHLFADRGDAFADEQVSASVPLLLART
jgi:peroxin-5